VLYEHVLQQAWLNAERRRVCAWTTARIPAVVLHAAAGRWTFRVGTWSCARRASRRRKCALGGDGVNGRHCSCLARSLTYSCCSSAALSARSYFTSYRTVSPIPRCRRVGTFVYYLLLFFSSLVVVVRAVERGENRRHYGAHSTRVRLTARRGAALHRPAAFFISTWKTCCEEEGVAVRGETAPPLPAA